MKELLRRLLLRPKAALELLASTLCINLLSFASPVFIMLILSEYVNSGFDGTLVTLSLGMLLAMLLQLVFTEVRTIQAAAVGARPDRELAASLFETLSRARIGFLERIPASRRADLGGQVQAVQGAYAAPSVLAVYDAPFSLLFLAATYWMNGPLGWVGLLGVAATLACAQFRQKAVKDSGRALTEASAASRGLLSQSVAGAEVVRAFGGAAHLARQWTARQGEVLAASRRLAGLQGDGVSLAMLLMVLTRVGVYAVGAKEVVLGDASLSAVVVANILVGRALRQVQGFTGAVSQFAAARQAMAELADFFRLPREAESGVGLRRFEGRVELRDLSFGFPGSSGPLFESLRLSLAPGMVLAVSGPNGSGKTTLARLLLGLLDPMRGEVLVDGVNLRQMAPEWWRKQVQYAPQEPVFLNATLRENLTLANPGISEPDLARLLEACGLVDFLALQAQGLDTPVKDGGRSLSWGVRRRLGLVRALATGGRLVVLDEPTEGLDAEGAAMVQRLLHAWAAAGRTVVVATQDSAILRGAHALLDLGVKPTPSLTVRQAPGPAATEEPHA